MARVLVNENSIESGGVDAPVPETESVDASGFAPLMERGGHQHPRVWSLFVLSLVNRKLCFARVFQK